MHKSLYLLAEILLIAFTSLPAQNDCDLRLIRDTEIAFEGGKFAQVIDLAHDPCIKNIHSAQALQLFWQQQIRAGLELDQIDHARFAMSSLLAKFPKFIPRQNEDPEIINLYNQFRRFPKFSAGLEGSINNVRVRLIREEPERQGAFAQTGGKETYQPGHGNGFGIIFNYQPRPSWRFSLGAGQSNQDYYYSFSSHRIDSLSKWRVNFTENLSFWEIPVMVAWLPPVLSGNSTRKIQGRGFRFNLSTGLLTRILQSANNSIERIDNSEPPDRYFNNGVDASGRRKPLQTCLQGGAGLEYHFSPIRIQFQYLSVLGLNNIVRNKFTIISSPLLWDYHHVDNDLALDHTWKLTLSISYNLAFGFKPQTP